MPGQKHLFQRRDADPLSFSMSAQSCAHIFHPCRFHVSYGSGEAVKVKVNVKVNEFLTLNYPASHAAKQL